MNQLSSHPLNVTGAYDKYSAPRVLVIDDSDFDRLVIKKSLLKKDCNVYLASNANIAIEIINEVELDIIFISSFLSCCSPVALVNKIKSKYAEQYIPVISIIGSKTDTELDKYSRSGCDDFILKPVKETILEAKVNTFLKVKKMHDQLLQEKEMLSTHANMQIKDLLDADKVIYNLHAPLFHTTDNINWSCEAQNILTGDLICSAISPSGHHIILVGDNTGHGVPSAIGSMIASQIFYTMVNKGFNIEIIIEEINQKLKYLLPIDRFLAMGILDLDEDYQVMKVWNAGLPDILVCDSKGILKEKVSSTHMPLGIEKIYVSDIKASLINLADGDCIYAYTDGLTETFNKRGEFYGEERLIDSILENHSYEDRVDKVLSDIESFKGDYPITDDVLFMEIICDSTLSSKKKKQNKSNTKDIKPMDWNFSIELGAEYIRDNNPIPVIVETLSGLQGLSQHREKLFMILSEMYSNAVEHGILDLDSSIKDRPDGFINYYKKRESKLEKIEDANVGIDIKNNIEGSKGVISISLEDSGNGFDFNDKENLLNTNVSSSGRGIPLLKSLCRKLEYSNHGKKLDIEYEWEN